MISEQDYRELERQATLILSPECQELLALMQAKILSLSKSEIEPLELKGMLKLMAFFLEIPSDYENEKNKLDKK